MSSPILPNDMSVQTPSGTRACPCHVYGAADGAGPGATTFRATGMNAGDSRLTDLVLTGADATPAP
jgi:hypothetical protein